MSSCQRFDMDISLLMILQYGCSQPLARTFLQQVSSAVKWTHFMNYFTNIKIGIICRKLTFDCVKVGSSGCSFCMCFCSLFSREHFFEQIWHVGCNKQRWTSKPMRVLNTCLTVHRLQIYNLIAFGVPAVDFLRSYCAGSSLTSIFLAAAFIWCSLFWFCSHFKSSFGYLQLNAEQIYYNLHYAQWFLCLLTDNFVWLWPWWWRK